VRQADLSIATLRENARICRWAGGSAATTPACSTYRTRAHAACARRRSVRIERPASAVCQEHPEGFCREHAGKRHLAWEGTGLPYGLALLNDAVGGVPCYHACGVPARLLDCLMSIRCADGGRALLERTFPIRTC
jgi:hypothetical protein